ncbi:hypothetical protein I3760_08G077500 [Carya illinoinensis]|uniref:Vacuolar ATPase assembly protein VMA22 n=1 Tax=Carya illinoinensis TaxID=32201 RepID=A0A8T1PRA2_CARIL|nr:uncharacterized protein LOC122319109 isoform X2 [Carya illinoinensis]KAG2692963.1 hypothetical protein I3760_08G077500 [Carya illinoinensis]KAG6644748.1 hypothetical protein CIPAW_08G075400 [Carya illinoinensis]KAG6699645.1 hypothetical protein I3842_08G076800 [Carya illinoinensis]
MEEQDQMQSSIEVEELEEQQQREGKRLEEENVVRFLDSLDSYVTLLDSLSSTLRQGWLELASARQSMGASRINGALLDLKFHSAATSLQVTHHDDEILNQPHFTLCKWASSKNGYGDEKLRENKLQTNSDGPQLRHRSQFAEKIPETKGAPLIVDDQVQKERTKSLSMFGTLVSPKLRAAQLSFETALETLVEIANVRLTMLSTSDQVRKELEGTEG